MHRFTLEIRVKWPFAIHPILERAVSIRTERTRKHTDVTEDALQGGVRVWMVLLETTNL